jgi:hypothetical protein
VAAAMRASKMAIARRGELLSAALSREDPAVRVDPETGTAACTVRGSSVRFRFDTRGAGSSAESWTEVEVDVAPSPLVLAVRRQHSQDKRLIQDGLAVDIQLGDPLIDEKYLFEGAPVGTVRRVLGPAFQQKLLALDLDEIEIKSTGIQLARRGWKQEHADVQALVDFAVTVAESIGPAVAEAKKAEAPPPASAYRGSAVSPQDQQKWQAAQQEVASRHAAEVKGLEAMRERRRESERERGVVILVIVLGVMALMLVFALAR